MIKVKSLTNVRTEWPDTYRWRVTYVNDAGELRFRDFIAQKTAIDFINRYNYKESAESFIERLTKRPRKRGARHA